MKTDYLDLEAYVGVTKHLGGISASRRLLEACRVAEAREVLDVGCGVGVEPVRIATTTSARVVGLDISEQMLAWADQRAREAGVRGRIELVRGDVLDLPFASDRFDAVLCESVLAFVEDKERAIRELVRVTRPGGSVGLNEAFHFTEAPSAKVTSLVTRFTPEDLITLDTWKALWAGSGLRDRTVRVYRLEAGRELRGSPPLVRTHVGAPWAGARGPRVRRAAGSADPDQQHVPGPGREDRRRRRWPRPAFRPGRSSGQAPRARRSPLHPNSRPSVIGAPSPRAPYPQLGVA